MPAARTQQKAAAARSAKARVPASILPNLVCDKCEKRINRPRDLERHKAVHLPRSEWPFKCMMPLVDSQGNESPCPFAANQKGGLNTHQNSRLHLNVKKPCGYEGCTFECTDDAGLCKHRQKKHNILPKVPRAMRAPKVEELLALGVPVESEPVASRSLSSLSPSSSFTSSTSSSSTEFELDFWSHSSTTSSSRTYSPSSCASSPRPLTQEATFIIEETIQPNDLGGFLRTPQSSTLGQYDLNVAAQYQMGYNAVNSVPYAPLFCDEPYFPSGYWSAFDEAWQSVPDTQEIDQWRVGIVRSHSYPY
ncbi:hypothetical protein DFP72DRAFT_847715 [Ephemerocybe angulata]|uniref:C2H2-type domain-containing protein n=1 Tax=Ephemerocybe angulata TaxID=980116 RepID=A0A8H6HXQ0_9AGAR|nr:hypothetical protein DFP72DRAFT_847715 [Tulosesus angulatus]